ncbi:MAG: sulfatase-like hydrolase/transferase, partial [Planctomycetota bacterium]
MTDLTGDAAIEFIRNTAADQPFCLSVSFNAGHAQDGNLDQHYPFPATEADLYTDLPMPRPRLEDGAALRHPEFLAESMNTDRYAWRWDTPEKYDRNLRNYFRMLSGLDRNIGRVVDELEARGLAENTVVIFIGDNGYYMGERGFAGKWTHYDESLRVPLIVFDPRLPAAQRGRTIPPIALNLDVAPTVIAAAGLPVPADMQGRSLLPFAHDDSAPDGRDGFFCEHLMKNPRIPRWEGYRTTTHMYARYIDAEVEFLHDLESDPDQLANLAGDRSSQPTLRTLRRSTRTAARELALGGTPLPRVLLLGDSISMGYHQDVVDALVGEMHV